VWFTDRRISSTNTTAATFGSLALLTLLGHRPDAVGSGPGAVALSPATARAADPAPANAGDVTATVTAVAPEQFAAGTTITISGAGFVEGDTVKLDGKLLTDLKVDAASISGAVPAKAIAGKKLIGVSRQARSSAS
jgi:hypothetical protein